MFTAGNPASSRILVVRLGAMGDIIHTLPAVARLKQSHPASHLTWLVEPRWAPLLEDNPYVDRVVILRRHSFAGLVETRRELRAAHYDFAVDFQGLLKSAMAGSAASPDRFYGFHQSQVRERLAAFFYSHKTMSRCAHVVDRNLESGRSVRRRDPARGASLPSAPRPSGGRPAGRRFRARLSAGRLGLQAVADGPLWRACHTPARRTRYSAGARRSAGRGLHRSGGARFRTIPACPD